MSDRGPADEEPGDAAKTQLGYHPQSERNRPQRPERHRARVGVEIPSTIQPTIFGVLGLANAAVRSGPLVVVLGQGQGPDARTRRRLAARGFRLLQAAVVIAVLRSVLQVLDGVGGGEGHTPMGVLETERQQMNTFDTKQVFHLR